MIFFSQKMMLGLVGKEFVSTNTGPGFNPQSPYEKNQACWGVLINPALERPGDIRQSSRVSEPLVKAKDLVLK